MNKIDKKWIIILTFLSFFISLLFSLISETIIPDVSIIIGIIITLLILFIGILFDMIGVAVSLIGKGRPGVQKLDPALK